MKRHVIESWLWLVALGVIIRFFSIRTVYWLIDHQRVRLGVSRARVAASVLSSAVDLACVFYFVPVKCLQRSAVTTLMLRRNGWAAQLVIGAQVMPPKSHAWAELDGEVVNDRPYIREMYQVVDRKGSGESR